MRRQRELTEPTTWMAGSSPAMTGAEARPPIGAP